MDKNPLLKYIMKDEKRDVIHSSAYAMAQNGGAVGAVSVQSFEQRQALEQNRTKVRAYSDSRVAQGARSFAPRAKVYEGDVRGQSIGQVTSQGEAASGERAVFHNDRRTAQGHDSRQNAHSLHSAGGALGGMRRAAPTPAARRAFTPPVRRPFGK